MANGNIQHAGRKEWSPAKISIVVAVVALVIQTAVLIITSSIAVGQFQEQVNQFKEQIKQEREDSRRERDMLREELKYIRTRMDSSSGGNHNNNRINIGNPPELPTGRDYLTTAEVAEREGKNEDTIRRWIAKGSLEGAERGKDGIWRIRQDYTVH